MELYYNPNNKRIKINKIDLLKNQTIILIFFQLDEV